jgi:fatty-acyl-CoA synthase
MNLHTPDSKRDPAKTSPAKAWLRALEMTAPIAANPARTLPAMLDALAAAHGDAPALVSDAETLSYRALAARANRYARWALAQGLAKGETVGLLMPNRPDYMAAWLGISRVGGVVALLNTNLTGRALAHCIDIVAPRYLIVASELTEAFAGARPHLAPTRRASPASTATCSATRTGRSMRPSSAPSRSTTRRSTSTPRGPPACPRRRTSATPG